MGASSVVPSFVMRTIYRASRVITLGHPEVGEWVLVDGRHVQRVGRGEPPTTDRLVELPGATILPGFTDAHVHLTQTALHARWPQVALARSKEELLTALRGAAASKDGPVCCFGFDDAGWSSKDLPTVQELDAVSDRPLVVVRADVHLSLANSAAMRSARIDERDVDLSGIDRDELGAPTGLLKQQANDAIQRWFAEQIDDDEIQLLQLEAASAAVARGVTCVHEMAMPRAAGVRDVEVLLSHRARLPVHVVPYVATFDIGWVLELGLRQIGGDLAVDGSFGARTAFLSKPYSDRPGERGVSYIDREELTDFLRDAHAAGLQVGLHVIGDAAISRALDAWEAVAGGLDSRLRRHFRARRHRLEHAECVSVEQIERAAALGLAISIQPSFDAFWGRPGGMYEERLGQSRASAANPFKTMIDHGLDLGVGSDSPVTPLDPLAAVMAMEGHHDPEQRLDRASALRLAIQGGPRIAGMERLGRLEPGSHADFIAFDEDPFEVDDLGTIAPIYTVSKGRDVFAR